MNRKLFYVLAVTVFIVGVGSSSELVREEYFEYYDLLLKNDAFEVKGTRFGLRNSWVVESASESRIIIKKAGLVSSDSELITIFPKNEIRSPCKEVGELVNKNGFSMSHCVFNNPRNGRDILVYDFIDHEMFVFAIEEAVVNSFFSSLETIDSE